MYTPAAKRGSKYQKSVILKLCNTTKKLRLFVVYNNLIMKHISIENFNWNIKMSKSCLKMYNFQNTVIEVIILKRLLYWRGSQTHIFHKKDL